MKLPPAKPPENISVPSYAALVDGIGVLLETARRSAARTVNVLMTATYWEIGRRIVEFEQRGEKRAGYGQELLKRLSSDLGARLGRGFGVDNLQHMRGFYLAWGPDQIYATMSRKSTSTGIGLSASQKSQKLSAALGIGKSATMSRIFDLSDLAQAFRLPWSHYVHLLTVKTRDARAFYEVEALRNGWSARQLDRQISSLFYERTALSKNKANMLVGLILCAQ
jgi:hypothetical protein